MVNEKPPKINTSEDERIKALEINAEFNRLREVFGKKYGWAAVMNAIAAFGKKIEDVYGESRKNYRLYHVLAGSTINPSRENEITGFDFPPESGLSIEAFIKNELEKAVGEESKKRKK